LLTIIPIARVKWPDPSGTKRTRSTPSLRFRWNMTNASLTAMQTTSSTPAARKSSERRS